MNAAVLPTLSIALLRVKGQFASDPDASVQNELPLAKSSLKFSLHCWQRYFELLANPDQLLSELLNEMI